LFPNERQQVISLFGRLAVHKGVGSCHQNGARYSAEKERGREEEREREREREKSQCAKRQNKTNVRTKPTSEQTPAHAVRGVFVPVSVTGVDYGLGF